MFAAIVIGGIFLAAFSCWTAVAAWARQHASGSGSKTPRLVVIRGGLDYRKFE